VPRAGLSPATVVDAALAIVDESGAQALTLSAVAARTGVATPSLYKHVDGLAGLRRLVRLRVTGELGRVLAAAVAGRTGVDALRALAYAYRSFVRQRPHRVAFHQTAPPADDAEALAVAAQAVTVVADVLRGYGVTPALSTHAIRCVRAAVQGFAALEASGGFGLPDDIDASFEHLIDLVVAGLDTMRDPRRATGGRPPAHPAGMLPAQAALQP
jgi:AcrR family transcriptional regulator